MQNPGLYLLHLREFGLVIAVTFNFKPSEPHMFLVLTLPDAYDFVDLGFAKRVIFDVNLSLEGNQSFQRIDRRRKSWDNCFVYGWWCSRFFQL